MENRVQDLPKTHQCYCGSKSELEIQTVTINNYRSHRRNITVEGVPTYVCTTIEELNKALNELDKALNELDKEKRTIEHLKIDIKHTAKERSKLEREYNEAMSQLQQRFVKVLTENKV